MTHQNLVLTEEAIKGHCKRLNKELLEVGNNLSLCETQNLFSKALGFNNFHELKKILNKRQELTIEELNELKEKLYKKKYKQHYINNHYNLSDKERKELDSKYLLLFDLIVEGNLLKVKDYIIKNSDLDLNFRIKKRTWEPASIIEFALTFEHIEIVNYLIDTYKEINLHISHDYIMRHSCKDGYLILIEKLFAFTQFDYSTLNNSFVLACHYGHIEIVKYLLKNTNVDIHFCGDRAIKEACNFGQLHIVKYLLTSNELKDHANIFAKDNFNFKFETGKDIRDMFVWELESTPAQRHWDTDRSKLFNVLNFLLNDYDNPKIRSWFKENQILKRYIID
jgi:hypothetical protein